MPKRRPTIAAGARTRRVKLFRNGRNQALRIPREFELPGKQAVLRREGNRLILEPVEEDLLALLRRWEPLPDEWPEIADPPAEAVEL